MVCQIEDCGYICTSAVDFILNHLRPKHKADLCHNHPYASCSEIRIGAGLIGSPSRRQSFCPFATAGCTASMVQWSNMETHIARHLSVGLRRCDFVGPNGRCTWRTNEPSGITSHKMAEHSGGTGTRTDRVTIDNSGTFVQSEVSLVRTHSEARKSRRHVPYKTSRTAAYQPPRHRLPPSEAHGQPYEYTYPQQAIAGPSRVPQPSAAYLLYAQSLGAVEASFTPTEPSPLRQAPPTGFNTTHTQDLDGLAWHYPSALPSVAAPEPYMTTTSFVDKLNALAAEYPIEGPSSIVPAPTSVAPAPTYKAYAEYAALTAPHNDHQGYFDAEIPAFADPAPVNAPFDAAHLGFRSGSRGISPADSFYSDESTPGFAWTPGAAEPAPPLLLDDSYAALGGYMSGQIRLPEVPPVPSLDGTMGVGNTRPERPRL